MTENATTTDGAHLVTSVAQLEAIYGEPYGPAVVKEIDHVNADYRAFIEAAPFCAIATSGPGGLDCTPRGDPPGFVRVADEKTLLIPDRRGNNRIDSLRNLVADPRIALLVSDPRLRRDDSRQRARRDLHRSRAVRELRLCRQDAAHGHHRDGRAGLFPMFESDRALEAVGPRNAHRPRDTADVRHHPRPHQQGCDRRPRARPRRARTHQGDDLLIRFFKFIYDVSHNTIS